MILSRVIGLLLGYVFGLFPTGMLMGKAHQTDLKKEGSGNTGMTNSIRVLGWKAGVTVFFGDFFKAVIPMIIVWAVYRNLYPEAVKLLMLYAGTGAVLGHNFPFYAKFKGGKGIACSIGTIIAFDWRMAPICAVLFFLTVVPTGFMSLGSLGFSSGFFVQTTVFGQLGFLNGGAAVLPELSGLAAILTALAFIQHRGNLKRLATGTENKFAPSKKDEKETED
ncbi:MAG: glycerol-3-phosphate acyltransferase [Clostridiales bacterium]|nr:glycerol-3-phosphate acyltransferase [Clostridiales bacterium]